MITQQFIELKALIIKISILKLFGKPVASPWGNAQNDGEGTFFLLTLNFLLSSPSALLTYIVAFFLLFSPPPRETVLQMKVRGENSETDKGWRRHVVEECLHM